MNCASLPDRDHCNNVCSAVVDEADVHVSLSGQERNAGTISHRTHLRSDGCIRQYRANETTRGRRAGGLIRTKHVGSMDVFN